MIIDSYGFFLLINAENAREMMLSTLFCVMLFGQKTVKAWMYKYKRSYMKVKHLTTLIAVLI